MEMIGHESISVEIERITLPNLSESIKKGSKITVSGKYLLAVISPRYHMVEQPRCMDSGMAWHGRQITELVDLGKSDTLA